MGIWSVATEGDSGNPFPVPHRGCPVGTGGWMNRAQARSDRRGFGESFPRAPPGLSRRDWGLDESCAKRVATEGDSGNPFPVPHRGCPVGTGGEVYLSYLELRYSSIAAAALRPAPIARITVAAPVTASPPANMPSLVVRPSASASSPPRRVA